MSLLKIANLEGQLQRRDERIAELEKLLVCKACNGVGWLPTGIDEAPTTECKRCRGSVPVTSAKDCADCRRGLACYEHDAATPSELGNAKDARREYLQPADLGDLMRFDETTSDDEGYDIGKPAIKRLAEIGAVQSHGFGKYSMTEFGSFVLDHMFGQNPALPLVTNEDRGRAAILASAKPVGEVSK